MTPARRIRARALLLVVVAVSCALSGCALRGCRTVTAYRGDAGALDRPPTRHRLRAKRGTVPTQAPASMPSPPPVPPGLVGIKVHPAVRLAIQQRPNDIDTLLVTFRDSLGRDAASIRRFTRRSGHPDSLTLAPGAIESALRAARDSAAAPLDTLLLGYRAEILRHYWLIQATVVRMRLGAVDSLAAHPSVVRIDPQWGAPPPQPQLGCSGATDYLDVGRARLGSDAYVTANHGTGDLALLDTGVMRDHPLLQGGSIAGQLDCNELGCTPNLSQVDAFRPSGHGTAAAAILAGGGALGSQHKGVTQGAVTSYKVFGVSDDGTIRVSPMGAAWAMSDALAAGQRVIVVEIADGDGSYGSMTQAANWAYDWGAVVVAADGNARTSAIPEPANAPRALGVGACCVATPDVFNASHTWGPTPDQRVKPDLAATTSVRTAATDGTALSPFSGTSGATPFVGAAALLLRNWMESGGTVVEPGQVYATLSLCGRNAGVDASTGGAGRIELPGDGAVWWGRIDVASGESWTLPIPADVAAGTLQAAIWWPEYGGDGMGFPRNDERARIALTVLDPATGATITSDVTGSVFQRARLSRSPAASGNWKIRLDGLWVPGDARQVYWATWSRP